MDKEVMRIAIYAGAYEPSIGGTITRARTFAHFFAARGHHVVVVTETSGPRGPDAPFELHRGPLLYQRLKIYRRSDVVLVFGVAARTIVQAWAMGCRVVITHPSFPGQGFREAARYRFAALAQNVACSDAVRRSLPGRAMTIPNPYDDSVFFAEECPRLYDIAFVGRLVPEKGLRILLEALHRLRTTRPAASLTVIGDGPDLPAMQALCDEFRLRDQIRFLGSLRSTDIARELRQHRVIAVPSVWEEPFGIVALEGIASGCIPVVARSGGLPAAAGGCGAVYEKRDAAALAAALQWALDDPEARVRFAGNAPTHLARHTSAAIGDSYLELMESIIATRRHRGRATLKLNEEAVIPFSHTTFTSKLPATQSIQLPATIKLFIKAVTAPILKYCYFRTRLTTDSVRYSHGGGLHLNLDENRARHVLRSRGVTQPLVQWAWRQINEIIAPTLVIDAGANYGEIVFSLVYDRAQSILIIEPNPYLHRYLAASVVEHPDRSKMSIIPLVLLNHAGEVNFLVDCKWSGTSSAIATPMDAPYKGDGPQITQQLRVAARSLEEIVHTHVKKGAERRFVIKLDIEGAEVAALRGAHRLFSAADRFAIIAEFNAVLDAGSETRLHSLWQELEHLGTIFQLGRQAYPLRVDDPSLLPKKADVVVLSSIEDARKFEQRRIPWLLRRMM
jgi:glycogen(starch) synthase